MDKNMNIPVYAEQTEKLLKELYDQMITKARFLLLNILTKYDERFDALKRCID